MCDCQRALPLSLKTPASARPPPAAGFAEMEVQLGNVLSAPRAILVLPDPAAVAEVRQLEANSAGVPDVDAFLRNAGLVVQYLHRDQAPDQEGYDAMYTPDLRRRIGAMAQEVVVAAAARGWPALAALLLPATTAGGVSGTAALASMDALCPASTTLAGLASSGPLRDALAAWASAEGVDLAAPSAAAAAAAAGSEPPSDSGEIAKLKAAAAAAATFRARDPAAFAAAFHWGSLWKDAMAAVLILICTAVVCLRVRRGGRVLWGSAPPPALRPLCALQRGRLGPAPASAPPWLPPPPGRAARPPIPP